MKTLYRLLLFSLLVFISKSGVPDNEGTEFVFAFGSNYNKDTTDPVLEVFVTTRKESAVSFNYTKDGNVMTANVTRGEIYSYIVNPDQKMSDTAYYVTEPKGQIIMAEDDIVVYASNKMNYSVDAFTALPTDVLGTEYVVPAWRGDNYDNGGSMIVIAAVYDDTDVSISLLGQPLLLDDYPSYLVNLNRGEALQYLGYDKAEDLTNFLSMFGLAKPDVTGALVKSSKPVAVTSGNKRCFIDKNPAPGVEPTSDHIVEMIPPIPTLGREFLTAGFYERNGDIFRIIGANNSTNVSIWHSTTKSEDVITFNNVGEFHEVETIENENLWIQSTGPLIVAQYSQSATVDGAESDPMMTLVPPREQYGNYYTFATPTGVSQPYRNYVNIIIESQETDGLLLDEQSVTKTFSQLGFFKQINFTQNSWVQDDWTPIGTTGYSARTLAILHGTHTISHQKKNAAFNAVMYGQVENESYGFLAGSRFAKIGDYCAKTVAVPGDGIDNDCDGKIDEEVLNGIDDDGDTDKDEDLAIPPESTTTELSITTTPAITSAVTSTEATTETSAVTTDITTSSSTVTPTESTATLVTYTTTQHVTSTTSSTTIATEEVTSPTETTRKSSTEVESNKGLSDDWKIFVIWLAAMLCIAPTVIGAALMGTYVRREGLLRSSTVRSRSLRQQNK